MPVVFTKSKNAFQAQRTHLYQRFNRLGDIHFKVTIFYWIVAIAQGRGALWMITIPGPRRLAVFIPFLIFQTIYTFIIEHHARKEDLL